MGTKGGVYIGIIIISIGPQHQKTANSPLWVSSGIEDKAKKLSPIWLVVDLPLWKIWKSMGLGLSHIWNGK